ncbi:family 43 glycosylhydrolase [Candidatus Pacearchaeota archaeon]|nr:family 43 glycosylhydrolase [Candidatus Pacearchaeota archaeon]MBD3283338.1 family 43 glycosylhydrolase [Candidatus Pacearchaeota archaeon]
MKRGYAPKGKYVWDLWFIKEKGYYHVFFLQSNKTKNPEDRHNNKVSIGHAKSKDLIHWTSLPTALKPGKKGEWDDLSLWTGDVYKRNNKYYMLYTGRNHKKNNFRIQRIGLAISDDLIHWTKHTDNPVLEADKRYYQITNSKNKLGMMTAWRDPYIFEENNKYYAIISARKKSKKKEHNACIAIAESKDLIKWKIKKPLLHTGVYDSMECPQLIKHKNCYYLFFSVPLMEIFNINKKKKIEIGKGLHCYYSSKLFGKYKPVNRDGIVYDSDKLYDLKLIENKGDEFIAIGWINYEKEKFIGKLSRPIKLLIKKDKVLVKIKEWR